MTVGILYTVIFIALLVGAILVGCILSYTFKKTKSIDLVQTGLSNSDASIANVISYLKITNEWSDGDASKG